MTDSEKYGLGRKYKEIEIAEGTLYDFLKLIESNYFAFDVFHKEAIAPLYWGFVYKDFNDVENLLKKNDLIKIKNTDVWKVFKFYSLICKCYVYRIILED